MRGLGAVVSAPLRLVGAGHAGLLALGCFLRRRSGLAGVALTAALAAALSAANVKLFLKDGSDQLVREYKVESDRVRFYSVERSGWEEVPLELVDLERTRAEEKSVADEQHQRAEEDRVEREAERAGRTELQRVPLEDGVYWVDGEKVTALKQGDPKTKGNKRRSVLKAIAPIPIVAGKGTVELEGLHAAFVVTSASPQFYVRLDRVERLGIARLTAKKDSRIVEDLTIIPVTKEVVGQQKEVEVFRQQLAPTVYKIWPVAPIEPGEYAVVQFAADVSDAQDGKRNLRVWDFACRNSN